MLIFHPTQINMNLLKSLIAILITFYNCVGATSTISHNFNLMKIFKFVLNIPQFIGTAEMTKFIHNFICMTWNVKQQLQFCDKKQDYKNWLFFSSKTVFHVIRAGLL